MGPGRGDDVDDIDIGTADHGLPVIRSFRNGEMPGHLPGSLPYHIAENDHLGAGIPLPAGDVGEFRPFPGPQDGHASIDFSSDNLAVSKVCLKRKSISFFGI